MERPALSACGCKYPKRWGNGAFAREALGLLWDFWEKKTRLLVPVLDRELIGPQLLQPLERRPHAGQHRHCHRHRDPCRDRPALRRRDEPADPALKTGMDELGIASDC